MAELPCSFTMEQTHIVFMQLYRIKKLEKGPLSNNHRRLDLHKCKMEVEELWESGEK